VRIMLSPAQMETSGRRQTDRRTHN